MARSPEGPHDPLEARRTGLLQRVTRLRQHPKAFGNQVIQGELTELQNYIRGAKDDLAADVIDAGLDHIEEQLDSDV